MPPSSSRKTPRRLSNLPAKSVLESQRVNVNTNAGDNDEVKRKRLEETFREFFQMMNRQSQRLIDDGPGGHFQKLEDNLDYDKDFLEKVARGEGDIANGDAVKASASCFRDPELQQDVCNLVKTTRALWEKVPSDLVDPVADAIDGPANTILGIVDQSKEEAHNFYSENAIDFRRVQASNLPGQPVFHVGKSTNLKKLFHRIYEDAVGFALQENDGLLSDYFFAQVKEDKKENIAGLDKNGNFSNSRNQTIVPTSPSTVDAAAQATDVPHQILRTSTRVPVRIKQDWQAKDRLLPVFMEESCKFVDWITQVSAQEARKSQKKSEFQEQNHDAILEEKSPYATIAQDEACYVRLIASNRGYFVKAMQKSMLFALETTAESEQRTDESKKHQEESRVDDVAGWESREEPRTSCRSCHLKEVDPVAEKLNLNYVIAADGTGIVQNAMTHARQEIFEDVVDGPLQIWEKDGFGGDRNSEVRAEIWSFSEDSLSFDEPPQDLPQAGKKSLSSDSSFRASCTDCLFRCCGQVAGHRIVSSRLMQKGVFSLVRWCESHRSVKKFFCFPGACTWYKIIIVFYLLQLLFLIPFCTARYSSKSNGVVLGATDGEGSSCSNDYSDVTSSSARRGRCTEEGTTQESPGSNALIQKKMVSSKSETEKPCDAPDLCKTEAGTGDTSNTAEPDTKSDPAHVIINPKTAREIGVTLPGTSGVTGTSASSRASISSGHVTVGVLKPKSNSRKTHEFLPKAKSAKVPKRRKCSKKHILKIAEPSPSRTDTPSDVESESQSWESFPKETSFFARMFSRLRFCFPNSALSLTFCLLVLCIVLLSCSRIPNETNPRSVDTADGMQGLDIANPGLMDTGGAAIYPLTAPYCSWVAASVLNFLDLHAYWVSCSIWSYFLMKFVPQAPREPSSSAKKFHQAEQIVFEANRVALDGQKLTDGSFHVTHLLQRGDAPNGAIEYEKYNLKFHEEIFLRIRADLLDAVELSGHPRHQYIFARFCYSQFLLLRGDTSHDTFMQIWEEKRLRGDPDAGPDTCNPLTLHKEAVTAVKKAAEDGYHEAMALYADMMKHDV